MNYQRIIKFGMSGGVATGVHWLSMTIATKIGVGVNSAFALGFLSAVAIRFLIDRRFVFNKGQSKKYIQFPRYFFACLLTYFFSASCFGTLTILQYFQVWQNFVVTIVLTTFIGYCFVNRALEGTSGQRVVKQITALGDER